MAKIIGNTTTTPMARPDWAQTDITKADYIKNKPVLGALAIKNEITKTDLSEDIQKSLEDSVTQEYVDNAIAQASQIQIITWEADD